MKLSKASPLFAHVAMLISERMTDAEFDAFALALDSDGHLRFEASIEEENKRRNPDKYVVISKS